MGEPSREHFFHARVIIRAFHGLYLKFPVIAPLGLTVRKDDHGTDGFKSVRI